MGSCFWCGGDCKAECLNLKGSTQMKTDDPAYWMLSTENVTSTSAYDPMCYICRDPEFAQMGLPLCYPCPSCQKNGKTGHVPADDVECTECGANLQEYYEENPNG